MFVSRPTFPRSITNCIHELLTWWRPKINPKNSGTVSPLRQPIKLVHYNQDKLNTYSFFHSTQCDSICIAIWISLPQLLIYISSRLSKWVAPIGFARSMRQRPTQHFIWWKPLSARRPRAHRISSFFSPLPVGSIYIRRENPLRLQSFQTRVEKTVAKNWSWNTHHHRGRWTHQPPQSHVGVTAAGSVSSQDGEFRESEKKACYLLFQSINFYL